MVIGAHDSMISILNGGQCHIWRYSCTPITRPWPHSEQHHINVNKQQKQFNL